METINREEAIELGAIDTEFYNSHFFPKTCRQSSPDFHRDCLKLLEDPRERYVGIKIFRDGAKTSLLRLFASKRIAYGISRTILIVGKSETAAMKTIDWFRRAVEFNNLWAQTFGLVKGTQWSGVEIDIRSTMEDFSVRMIALGITGSTRGINVDDYRPDLIIVDDPCDEENTATPEQRLKIEELFFGSLYQGLSPATDTPEAKLVLLQTPLDGEDLIEKAMKDANFATLEFSCFDEEGNSRWESRYPTETLRKEKEAFIARNQLTLWLREKEVTIVSSELSYFKPNWLRYWDILPEGGVNIIALDPTPPPKEISAAKRSTRLDDFVIIVLKYYKGSVYVCDYYTAKSPLPTEWCEVYFGMLLLWRPLKTGCETVVFQRMVKWYLEEKMREKQIFNTVVPIEDSRKKETRIVQTLSGIASTGNLYVNKTHTKLIEQFTRYPYVKHDDVIDALAVGLATRSPGLDALEDYLEGEFEEVENDDWRGAP